MGCNVLIVDDSAVTRSVIKKTLSICGVEIGKLWEAKNGLEALNVLDAQAVDVVFSDLNMPHMGGVELVETLARRQRLPAVPVVIVSSNRAEAGIQRLLDQGVRAYLKKPFRPEQIRDVLLQVLHSAEETAHVP